MNCLISVIIPVYNNEKWFDRCIKSIINQTYSNLEILIINDCSSDNVEDIILKYKDLDNRIIYFKNVKNEGVGYSRNIGIKESRGEYIYFLDSDDYLEKDALEVLLNTIKPNDTYSCMCAGYKEVDGVRSEVHRKIEDLEILKSPSVCMRLFNKRFIIESGILFSNIKVGEDLEFVFKLLIFNNSVSYIDKPLFTYVIHNDSSIRRYSDEQLDTIKALDSIYKYAIDNNKYEKYIELIEYVAVDHILVGTVSRIKRISNYKKESIEKCIDYIENKFPTWRDNNLVKKYLLSNNLISL